MTRKRKSMLLWKCAVCDNKKSTFIKKWEASVLLSSLGIKISIVNKLPVGGDILF